ncbi:hypothetical protein AB6A40_003509 [Gnathostoma spinigerum]|uniref:Uncharacterized protein n=1 Tax=Gnathostoma spinigerum TaxID=75299 RepID=A0ABD6EKK2_9BILA
MEESLRDDYSKVGAEAIGLMIDTSPALFSSVLRIIDRNLDSLEEFAVEILSLAPLAKCRLSEEEVGSICGKWLINRPPDHAGSRIARRILGSMNWGVLEDGQLWLPQNVHEECAETILKGHMTQCKGANSLIAKSWSAVSKLSSKLSEHEAVFDLFCWDVLLRLKLPSKSGHSSPPSDLVAFYLHIIQYSFSSPEFFLSDGLPYLYELISAGCYSAACVIIVRFISDFPLCVDDLVNIDGFLEYFDRLLHFGESSYAYQLIGGTNHFPGPVLRLLESAINYKLSEVCDESHLCAWGKLLCAKKLNEWNGDRNILYLIGVLVPIAFERDQHKIMGLLDCFRSTYASSIQRWKENAKGLLSWLGGDSELPPLIDTSNLGVSPWASFLLLKAEEICLSEFYKEYDVYMAKHMDYGLDQIVKKAGSKSHLPVALKHIRCIRWLDLCCTDGLYTHPVFPLACQHFAFYLFQRTSYFGSKVCRGRRIMSSDVAFMQVEKLQKQILPKAQNESEKEANNVALFYKAFSQWLRTPDIFDVEFRDFNTLLLDEQLQLLLIGDVCPFQFVDLNRLAEERINKKKVYSLTRHIGSFLPRKSYSGPTTITGLVQTVLKKTTYLPFPSLPLHEGLPEEPKIDISTASDPRRCIELCNMEINVINQAARTLLAARDKVEDLNTTYINEFAGLYADALTELSILLKCGNIFGYQCEKPVSVNVSVTASQYQTNIARSMEENRIRRSNELSTAYSHLVDSTSIHSARFEAIALSLSNLLQRADDTQKKHLYRSGHALFFHCASSLSSLEMTFLAVSKSFCSVFDRLGKAFIAGQPDCQREVMNLVLNGSHLAHMVVPHFTPECVPTPELLFIYSTLSSALRVKETSSAAFELMERLNINNINQRMSADHFAQLLPITFENAAMVSGQSEKYEKLCSSHFIQAMFYSFPDNLLSGLRLALSACDTGSTPVPIFSMIVQAFAADDVIEIARKPEYRATPILASDVIDVIRKQFVHSRRELSSRFFAIWSKYLPIVVQLCCFFEIQVVESSFDPDHSFAEAQNELDKTFTECCTLFGPLIEPLEMGISPWSPADYDAANLVVGAFVSLLKRLHEIYATHLPPGAENVEARLWQYYASKYIVLKRGGSHVHRILEDNVVRLCWQEFWPSMGDMSEMVRVMDEGASESGSLITQIVVRIPWPSIVQQQLNEVPEARYAFYGLLLTILSRCVARLSNYEICRASMPRLLASLQSCSWNYVKLDRLNSVSNWISRSFSPDVLADADEVTASFLTLFRRVCLFSTVSTNQQSLSQDECAKQAVYLKTNVNLMLRSTRDLEWMSAYFGNLIKATNEVMMSKAPTTDDLSCLSKELTAFLSTAIASKQKDLLVKTLREFLSTHPDSPLVLWLMRTTMDSVNAAYVGSALSIISTCIRAYFDRQNSNWGTVVNWVNLPDPLCRQRLFAVPKSDSDAGSDFLCLNTFILCSLHACTSASDETRVLQELLEYVTRIKPKNLPDEASFILIIEKLINLIVRQFSFNIRKGNEMMTNCIEWLHRVQSSEQSTSLFSMIGLSKKDAFPPRVRFISHVMELFLIQQTTSSEQPPRNAVNAPVLNSRVQDFKKLSSNKNYSQYESVILSIDRYFTLVQQYYIVHASELMHFCIKSLYSENFLQKL